MGNGYKALFGKMHSNKGQTLIGINSNRSRTECKRAAKAWFSINGNPTLEVNGGENG